MSELAIEASGLAKSFGDVRAVDGVDLAVPTGSVYGVLGPNGAGKTTTIRMLATLLRPDAGTIAVHGKDVTFRRPSDALARGLAPVYQEPALAPDLTVIENLRLTRADLGAVPPAILLQWP